MRFRLKSLAILLLCLYAQFSYAGEDSPELRTNQKPPAAADASQGASAVIEAATLEGQKDNQIEATGDATLSQGGKSIRADHLLYQQSTHDVEAQGSVVLKQDGDTMSGPHLQFNLDTNAGTMEQMQFFLKDKDINARGSADMLHIQDSQHYTMDNATYTTCQAGNQDWLLNMDTLEIDRTRQIGTAWGASVDFKGVPILYSPWMNFPLNNQNKSGFLAPVFGGTVSSGYQVTLPYYLSIAPNLDATITPTEMTKRGLMLSNEFRYLEPGYRGELNVDVLPNDALANRSREFFSLIHDQTLTSSLSGFVNATRVGDDNYFVDLGDAINVTSQVNLLQEAGLNYISGDWTAMLRAQRYQTLQDPAAPIVPPYARMPQLTVATQQSHSGMNLAFSGEYVDFTHPTEVNGSRLVLNPSVSYPLLGDSSFYITPKVALHGTYYALGANNPGALPNASRVLPLFSVDSGVAFERESNMFGGDYLQTLEPRAYYVYVPYRDQSALPNFDSALADYNFTQIFTENRFSGSDRIGDADQITLAATSRLLDQQSGAERLKFMVGERFSFITPQVNLPAPAAVAPVTTTPATIIPVVAEPVATIGRADILLAASGQVSKATSLDSELQFDPNQSQAELYNVAAHYHPEAGKVLNLGYRFQRDTLRQVDISTQWPLFNRWHMMGRWNYSLQDSRILEATGGLEYNQSCWTMRFVAQRFVTATLQTNTGLFFQLELNDFVKVGPDPLTMLKQSVPGYTKLNDDTASKPAQVLQ